MKKWRQRSILEGRGHFIDYVDAFAIPPIKDPSLLTIPLKELPLDSSALVMKKLEGESLVVAALPEDFCEALSHPSPLRPAVSPASPKSARLCRIAVDQSGASQRPPAASRSEPSNKTWLSEP